MINLNKQELLNIADRCIHKKWIVNDSGALISIHNIKIGLAKILSVQKLLNYPMDAYFIATPDLTPPKGISKWEWGLSAGGLLSWGDGDRPLNFLDARVSIGVALVGGLYESIDQNRMIMNIKSAKTTATEIGGILSQWDYHTGNHFINIYKTQKTKDCSLPPYIFILHGGAPEIKGPCELGDGLDYQMSSYIQQKTKFFDTPFGTCRVLIDRDAEKFFEDYKKLERFALEKHLAFAEKIFGEFEMICNKVHHGYINSNKVILGCYRCKPDERDLYPITLRSDLPSFLVQGGANTCRESNHYWGGTNSDSFPTSKLENVIPHGSGVTFPGIKDIVGDFRLENDSLLVFEAVNGNRIVVENLHSLISVYRGLEVIECVEKNKLAHTVAELEPLMSFSF